MLTKQGSRKPTRILKYTRYNQVVSALFVSSSSPQGKDVLYVTNFLFLLRKSRKYANLHQQQAREKQRQSSCMVNAS